MSPVEPPVKPPVETLNLERIILDFNQSDDLTYKFTPNLTKAQREVVHKLADHFSLRHLSMGEGNNRYITIGKSDAIIRKPTLEKTINSQLVNVAKTASSIPNEPNVEKFVVGSPIVAPNQIIFRCIGMGSRLKHI